MKLKEVAFMISLINANYRRRMLYFLLKMSLIVAVVIVLFVPNVIYLPFWSEVLLGLTTGFFMSSLFSTDSESKLPWVIKGRQMKALREVIDAKAPFEDLGHCVTLHEYFDK